MHKKNFFKINLRVKKDNNITPFVIERLTYYGTLYFNSVLSLSIRNYSFKKQKNWKKIKKERIFYPKTLIQYTVL